MVAKRKVAATISTGAGNFSFLSLLTILSARIYMTFGPGEKLMH
jgi:hypothetical protein